MIDPEQAHARVLARGTDSESLRDLNTLDAAYRSLPEFSGFTEVSASSTPTEVLSQLRQVMETRSPRLPALALPVLAADVG
jgi:dTMP kinase